MASLDLLNSTFEIYLNKAKDCHRSNRLKEARQYYLLAAEQLLKMAKQNKGQLQKAQFERAKNIIALADTLAQPQNKASSEEVGSDHFEVIEPEDISLEEALKRLDNLIGLDNVKTQIKNWVAQIQTFQMRAEKGLSNPTMSYHLVFSGNPGTGKTTVARLLGQIYKALGIVSKGHVIETERGDLVGGYVGHTAIQTRAAINKALGGILFIDEAYTLAKEGNDYGQEAIDTILKQMEDHRNDLVVICAGYDEPMEKFINSNPGLRSRFKNFIHFDDYSVDELYLIFVSLCKSNQYVLSSGAANLIRRYYQEVLAHKPKNFSNGRDVRNLFEKVVTAQSNRVVGLSNPSTEDLTAILECDIPVKFPKIEEPIKEELPIEEEPVIVDEPEPIKEEPKDEFVPPKEEPKQEDEEENKTPEDHILSSETQDDAQFKFEWNDLPSVGFADIAGLNDVKETVMNKVILPLKNPEAFEGYVAKGGGGLFLYGPPGTGKTMIAAAIAKEVGAKFCSIKPSDLLHQGAGNTEKAVRALFTQARRFDCAVIYFDEMDSICPKSTKSTYARQLRSELLSQLQGVDSYKKENKKKLLFLIAATNKPWDVDSAFIRPGRFGTRVYVGLPDAPARKYMIEKRISKIRSKNIVDVRDDLNIDEIVEKTNGFNGADISNLLDYVEEVSILRSVKLGMKYIEHQDFLNGFEKIHSSVQRDDIVRLQEWNDENL